MFPFVIKEAGINSLRGTTCNEQTADDPMPSVLDTSAEGYVLSGATRLTEVGRESTDDN
jgi:hypothetical protein